MTRDRSYIQPGFKRSEIEHNYGDNVHVLSDPYLFTVLSRLCVPSCKQPLVNSLLNTLYREMVKYVVNQEFSLKEASIDTRMKAMHPEGTINGKIIDPDTKVVSVNLARAGTVPSHICFDAFNYILNPDGVRQDHIAINRKTDELEKVIGTNLGGVKIGGPIDGAFVVFPDPMGATGSTIRTAIDLYNSEVEGTPKKFIAIHLIITPEYIRTVSEHCPDLNVYAIRLDRGLSPKHVLDSVPGTFLKEEKGLNEKQYIVPGAGGLGEIINNSYV